MPASGGCSSGELSSSDPSLSPSPSLRPSPSPNPSLRPNRKTGPECGVAFQREKEEAPANAMPSGLSAKSISCVGEEEEMVRGRGVWREGVRERRESKRNRHSKEKVQFTGGKERRLRFRRIERCKTGT